jgi:DNA polymerase-4
MQNKPDRQIFHADCNSFYASVEESYRPELRAVPMSVAGDPENRHGIILASNQLAKKRGVKTAERASPSTSA